MKKFQFFIPLCLLAASLSAQNVIKHPNENADTLKKNAFGINVSHVITSLLGNENQRIPLEISYKHYSQHFNLRLSAEISPDLLHKGYIPFYDSENSWVTYPWRTISGNIVMMDDSITLKRQFLRDNYFLELNAGIEKAKKTRIGTWIVGSELNVGYFKKDETYVYREYLNSRLDDTEYREIPFVYPNTSQAYAKGDYLKLGLNFVIGFEWSITKYLNLSATVNPNVYTFIKLSDTYSDLENQLHHTKLNFIDFDHGFVNIGAYLKF